MSFYKYFILLILIFIPLALSAQEGAAAEGRTEEDAETAASPAKQLVRVKDIAVIQGIRENQLTGIGLVTGLDGQGDSEKNPLLRRVLANFISAFNISVPAEQLKSKNCAVVSVTADIPAFVYPGDRIEVTVSSLGEAKSLESGILLQTPLRAANGKTYAAAQGKIKTARGRGAIQTVGTITDGAIMEEEVRALFSEQGAFSIILRRPDFSTAANLAKKIQAEIEGLEVSVRDSKLITVKSRETDNLISLITQIENMEIEADAPARVVINASSGVVVVGKNVKIDAAGISVGGAKITISTENEWEDKESEQFYWRNTSNVEDMVSMLQQIGLSTEKIIDVLKSLEAAGALHAVIEVM